MPNDFDWTKRAQEFYRQRGRVLKARGWLPEELEEEFVAECMLIEVAERRAASDSEIPATDPDRIRITTRALTAVRRTVRVMPWSFRSRLGYDLQAQSRSEKTVADLVTSDERWTDIQFVASLMDVVCAMHWMVWLSRKRSKPKGTGYTVRTLAAFVGVSRMRAARTVESLDDWFKRLWDQVIAGKISRVRAEIDGAEARESNHFSAGKGNASSLYSISPLASDMNTAVDWLLRCAFLPDRTTAADLLEKSIALGLVGDSGRYLITPERGFFSLRKGGQRDWLEDLGSLATCRQRNVSWNDLAGLQTMVSRHLQWVARIEDRDLKNPSESAILFNIDLIEDMLSRHPLGLQYLGTAFAQNKVLSLGRHLQS